MNEHLSHFPIRTEFFNPNPINQLLVPLILKVETKSDHGNVIKEEEQKAIKLQQKEIYINETTNYSAFLCVLIISVSESI